MRFLPLAIEDRDSVARVLADVDRANGCAFSGLAAAAAPLPPELTYGAGLRSAFQTGSQMENANNADIDAAPEDKLEESQLIQLT